MRDTPTSFRLSKTVRKLIDLLSGKYGISNTDVIEIAVREKAEREGIEWRKIDADFPTKDQEDAENE